MDDVCIREGAGQIGTRMMEREAKEMTEHQEEYRNSVINNLLGVGYNCTQSVTEHYDLHCHNFYEIYYFLEGDADYLVEGQQYHLSPHSLLLLSPHTFHGVRVNSRKPYGRYALHFHPDILSMEHRRLLLSVFPVFEKNPDQKVYFEEIEQYGLEGFLAALCEYVKSPPGLQEHLIQIGVEAVLARVVSICQEEWEAKPMSNDVVTEILIYLNRHLAEEITLDQLAEGFQINKYYLNRVFRKAVGTTVFDYLQRKRVIYAQQLLLNGCSASAASSAAGFQDYSSFYRAYVRVLGHSPLKDRGVLPTVSGTFTQRQMEELKI